MDRLMMASHIALWVMSALLFVTVIGIVRQIGLLHRRIAPAGARMTNAGPEVGSDLPGLFRST